MERSSGTEINTVNTMEIAQSEEVGFFAKGEGHLALEGGQTALDGSLPINPSGGLKGKGHPVGATGVAQAHEIVTQLRSEAGERQVGEARIGSPATSVGSETTSSA